jgi:hypothetical protein
VDVTTLSAAELNTELDKVEVMLGKILGIKPKWFRYSVNETQPLDGN